MKKNTLLLLAAGAAAYFYMKKTGVIASTPLTQAKMYDFLRDLEAGNDMSKYTDWIASLNSYDQSLIADLLAAPTDNLPSWLSDWVAKMPAR